MFLYQHCGICGYTFFTPCKSQLFCSCGLYRNIVNIYPHNLSQHFLHFRYPGFQFRTFGAYCSINITDCIAFFFYQLYSTGKKYLTVDILELSGIIRKMKFRQLASLQRVTHHFRPTNLNTYFDSGKSSPSFFFLKKIFLILRNFSCKIVARLHIRPYICHVLSG